MERRKTVTALFVDLVGSTAMGSQLDPETLRNLMARYYEVLRGTIEGHGGSVQKFIGDAVVAIFGTPVAHEDDALRAVRAAVEARQRLEELNARLEREFGVRIEIRTGINTGEVVVGDESEGGGFVVGDPVNVAARLEQSASPGETLLGEATYEIVRHAVSVERVEPLSVKGKDQPLAAYRLGELLPGAGTRAHRSASPLVGRDPELRLILDAFARAQRERACHLFTVFGPPGVGKSRLSEEVAAATGDRAVALAGRCLAYGDAITYWPLAEVLRGAARIDPDDRGADVRRKLAALTSNGEGETIAGILAQLIGTREGTVQPEELRWAVRRAFESISRRQPLLVVFEDIHWAAPALLELIAHVALMSRDAPILLLCLARPELLDGHPSWGGGMRNATSIQLEPLSGDESTELIAHLLDGAALPAPFSSRIATASEGTPLFVEEMIAMLVDRGLISLHDGRWTATGDLSTVPVPPTIQALLAARLDGLPDDERRVLELASVIGKEFWHAAVSALASVSVSVSLDALVRKDLIVPERSTLTGDDSFSFRHILIRDAAYASLPKARRAELHERFASWLEQSFADRLAEVEEIVGYHLEEAHRHRASLGLGGDELTLLAQRGAAHFQSAAHRALARHDLAATIQLLERAVALLPAEAEQHRMAGLDLARAHFESGAFERARALLVALEAASVAAGDELTAAHARVDLAEIGVYLNPEGATGQAAIVADATLPVFQRAGDDVGVARALMLGAEPDHVLARFDPFRKRQEEALVHLRRAGDQLWIPRVQGLIAHALAMGPVPIPAAKARMQQILEEAVDNLELSARVRLRIGFLLALEGNVAEALEAEAQAEGTIRELGIEFYLGSWGLVAGSINLHLGHLERAEQVLRISDEAFQRSDERSVRSTTLATLAGVLAEQGRAEEAEQTALYAIELGSSDDLGTLIHAHSALGQALVSRDPVRAEEAARRAVELSEIADMLWIQGDSWRTLADVLEATGRTAEAQTALAEALDRFDRKSATALAKRVRAQMSRLTALGHPQAPHAPGP